MALKSYDKVFDTTNSFVGNITIDLAARYAAAFGMLAAGKLIEKVFIEKKGDNDYSFETYPLVKDDLEYIQFQIPGLVPLTFHFKWTKMRQCFCASVINEFFSR
jgi:hypothetical protein